MDRDRETRGEREKERDTQRKTQRDRQTRQTETKALLKVAQLPHSVVEQEPLVDYQW